MSDISIKNLDFSYDGELVLKNVNLEFNTSDFLAIIGPNGGGKSTLLKLILGLLKPSAGELKVFGKKPSQSCKTIGYVPQSFALNQAFPLKVIDVVLMGLIEKKLFGFYSKEQQEIAMECLKMVAMDEFSQNLIANLSGGQRQRVYIARALASQAKILVLDEPTASVDTKTQAEIYALLKRINTKGCGIVLVSHDANIALGFANKVAYVSGSLHLHELSPDYDRREFITHLAEHHSHFCDVELALKSCSCH
ncbi:MAG: ABC transporter ATP-binding protein [Campylobacter sp.]|nr:ABC transporter ATP-binding protein [Campylobacter sp.]